MAIEQLADYITLVYHEARNVRHLTRQGFLSSAPWTRLISLPTNRDEAWRNLQSLRYQAKQAGTAKQALAIFQRWFAVTLDQLIGLYKDERWKRAPAYGGNAWAPIAEDVSTLAGAIDTGQDDLVTQMLDRLSKAEHNTGTVSEKLRKLDFNLQLHSAHK